MKAVSFWRDVERKEGRHVAELQLMDLCKTYYKNKQPIHAVKAVNLEANDGEFIALLGPSGCGKTTTLRMIAGLEEVTSGYIRIGDNVVNDVHPRDRGVGLAFENYALYPPLNVYENISFNQKARGLKKDEIKAEVSRIAQLLQIEDLLEMKPATLSGGQKQRVNIARAIIRRPQVLLLDEPLSHLDGKMRQKMRTEIKRLQSEIQATTIIVTHDQSEALALADRIAVLHEGELQQIASPIDIFNDPQNEFVAGFIGEPAMNIFTVETIFTDDHLQFRIAGTPICFPVPERHKQGVNHGGKYRFGIRPTDVEVVTETADYTFSHTVAAFENLGEECRVMLRINGAVFNVVSSEEIDYRPGETVYLKFKNNKINIFDFETRAKIN